MAGGSLARASECVALKRMASAKDDVPRRSGASPSDHLRSSSSRDLPGTEIPYFNPLGPRTEAGLLELGPGAGKGSQKEMSRRGSEVLVRHPVTVVDARFHNGGLHGWKLDEHGFCFIQAPDPVKDFNNKTQVLGEYVPRLIETVRSHTKASRVFFLSHLVRTEATGRGVSANRYARHAHSDYGPKFEPLFRRLLVHRYKVPEEEATSCGVCVLNLWTPIDRPAYRDPLCVLDYSSLDLGRDIVEYAYNGDLQFSSKRPEAERIPSPGQDAPSVAPKYSPKHRWVFCPDMRTDEAILFKQYDMRGGGLAATSFHASFHDGYHDAWEECPGRRSIECRLILTFHEEDVAAEQKGAASVSSKL